MKESGSQVLKVEKPVIVETINPLDALKQQGREVTFLIPQEVDGDQVLNSYMNDFKDELATQFGGYTVTEITYAEVKGDGMLLEDAFWQFTVTFDTSNTVKLTKLLDIVKQVKVDFAQGSMYVKIEHQVYSV